MSITTDSGTPPPGKGPSARSSPVEFLSALQLSDSFFPTGMYTLSHGLEAFVQTGLVSKAGVEALLLDYLENVVGPADAVALSLAHQATEVRDLMRLMEIDRRLFAMKLVKEAREASRRVGKRIVTTAVQLTPNGHLEDFRAAMDAGACPGTSAVALGAVAATFGIGREEAMLIQLYGFTASLLGAAMRLIRLGHDEAQGILARLKPQMVRVAQDNMTKGLEEMHAFAPLIDIMGMAHERAHIRLFIS